MRIASVGHAVFAAAMIGIGILGLVKGEFIVLWDAVPKDFPARKAVLYLCALIYLGCGAGLLWQRTAAPAARLLFIYLLVGMLFFRLRLIVLYPLVEVTYQNNGESAVYVAGAWVLYAGFAGDMEKRRLGFAGFAVGESGVRLARVLYGLALIAFGFSHYAYLDNTASLVPAWLPWHVFWAYFTGATYLAAGAAVLSGICARLAAALSALQMGLFGLLVWLPKGLAGQLGPHQWGEFVATCVLTAGAWVVADSYRGWPWFGLGRLKT